MTYSSRIIDEHDEEKLQKMLGKCDDFFQLIFSRNAKESEAKETLTELPKDKNYEDKFVIGIFDINLEIIGVIDIIRDYPEKNIWFLGLMIFCPEVRNNGLGKKVFDDTEEWALDLGADFIRLAVVEQNKKGYNFWKKLGFKDIKTKQDKLEGIDTNLIIMEKSLKI